jgi:hypothetical protein
MAMMDPLPELGGSYLLDKKTGKWKLLERTEPATHSEPQTEVASDGSDTQETDPGKR